MGNHSFPVCHGNSHLNVTWASKGQGMLVSWELVKLRAELPDEQSYCALLVGHGDLDALNVPWSRHLIVS